MIDNHDLFSASITFALRSEGLDAHRVPAGDSNWIMQRARQLQPGLALLDLQPGRDREGRPTGGEELVEPLRGSGWTVLIVGGGDDDIRLAAAIAAGAIGCVPKSSSFPALMRAALAAANGESIMSDDVRRNWIARHRNYQTRTQLMADRFARLRPRELQVLELLARGNRSAEAAEQLAVPPATVRLHVRSILTRLGVGTQVEAVALFLGQRRSGESDPRTRPDT
ncbi:MAG TPA: LuxR C-terminal-related transcriptional regulator [Pseudonocardia sp.]